MIEKNYYILFFYFLYSYNIIPFMEQLKTLNYMYFIYAAIAITIIVVLYLLYINYFSKSCQSCTVTNAPEQGLKRAEGFDNSEEEQKSKLMESEDKIKGELVLYYAMWCGHSRSFLPEFEKFEQYAKENLPQVRVTKVRCEDGNETVCKQKGVDGYPTVIMYPKKGQEVMFDKARKMESLVEFVNETL